MIIDSCYHNMLTKLTSLGRIKPISQQLLLLKTNSERVLLVYKVFEELNAFPSIQETKKNNDVSTHYRNLGNKCFQQIKYSEAWQYYNISLLNACPDSENYCLALSNRSAVFYEMSNYIECIKDIEKIFTLDYPKKLEEKLQNRKKMCNELLKKVNIKPTIDLSDILTMKTEKDSRYIGASKKLEVVYSKEMGRHVIAKEDIAVGEVIIEEDPYFTLLLKSQYLFSCNYCLSRSLNLLPCDTCCYFLYCSKECKEKSWNEYHQIECGLMTTLIEMDFTKLELLALRTVLKARYDHNDWNALFQTIEEAEANMNTEYHGHVKIDDKWIYDSKYYPSIHTLATNVEKRSVSDIFQKSVTAVVFLNFLKNYTNFMKAQSEHESEKIFECVAGLLLLHLMTTPTNMHGIGSTIGSSNGNFVDEVSLASAPYAFCSLINHSCAPNIVRFYKLGSGRVLMFALRPIKKGMQLLDNYGPHHCLENQRSRQETLTFQYKFTCFCEACVKNWPTYMQLTLMSGKIIPSKLAQVKDKIITQNIINKLQHGDIQAALNVYKVLCCLCEKLEPYVPCLELCECQESLKQCLAMFHGLVPHENSLMVKWEPVSTTN